MTEQEFSAGLLLKFLECGKLDKELYREMIAEAKRQGIIETNPLEKWDDYISGSDIEPRVANGKMVKYANEMRDYLLTQLEEAKQRVGCGKKWRGASNDFVCGEIQPRGVTLCDDCIKRIRGG